MQEEEEEDRIEERGEEGKDLVERRLVLVVPFVRPFSQGMKMKLRCGGRSSLSILGWRLGRRCGCDRCQHTWNRLLR